jgi:hypothetical protein
MSEVKQYAQRDLMGMDYAGNHYCRHVSAMTSEQLHSKSDIAAELGWRDMQIAELKAQSDALAAECATLKDINAWCQTEAFQNMYREFKTAEAIGCPDVDCMHDAMLTALMHAPKTPATDAYLNSVRNELVDEAIHALAASGAQSFGDCMVALNQLRAGEPS